MDISHLYKWHHHHHPHLCHPYYLITVGCNSSSKCTKMGAYMFQQFDEVYNINRIWIHRQMLIIGQCINTLANTLESCRVGINPLVDALDGCRVGSNARVHQLEYAHHILKIKRRRNNKIWGRGASEVEAISS